jgi:hypothetical protein
VQLRREGLHEPAGVRIEIDAVAKLQCIQAHLDTRYRRLRASTDADVDNAAMFDGDAAAIADLCRAYLAEADGLRRAVDALPPSPKRHSVQALLSRLDHHALQQTQERSANT